MMQRALTLARGAQGTTSPNPSVGAILCRDGGIVGEGFTQPAGHEHGEIMALRQAGALAKGASLYVTLEPCCYGGRTPPCTEALIDAGVTEVHMSMLDPNPRVDGQGKAQLEAAGIVTSVGQGQEQANILYEAHARYVTVGLPFVIAKFAMSLDGKIATVTGQSKWITGEQARHYGTSLRGIHDSVMVGVGTVIADDPLLTYRDGKETSPTLQPLRIVVDSKARTPISMRLLTQPGRTLLATAEPSKDRVAALEAAGAEVLRMPDGDGRVDIASLLRYLGKQEVTSVIVEGGSRLLGSFFDLRLVDKVLAFVAPVILGGQTALSPVAGVGAKTLGNALALDNVTVESFGADTLITGYPRRG